MCRVLSNTLSDLLGWLETDATVIHQSGQSTKDQYSNSANFFVEGLMRLESTV